ncbi:MAG: PID-CTERM protein-sorting domain-containing protein, partial [Flammeovirgaceae bacterium]
MKIIQDMKKLIFLIALTFSISVGYAQPEENDPYADPYSSDDNSTLEPEYDWSWNTRIPTAAPVPPVPVPIDGGTGFLIVAGIGYGLRELRKRKK